MDIQIEGQHTEVTSDVHSWIAEHLEALKVGLFVIGFHVPHVHVHVVPLYAMADMTAEAFERAQRTSPAVAVLVDSSEQIRQALAVMEDDDTQASGWHA
jgi:diadenosine tetraphosphate (Ap4A) HIT family hydrolase